MPERRAPSHQLRAVTCPHCGQRLVAASGLTATRPPKDGDVQICGICAGVGVFVAGPLGIALRAPTRAEREQLAADPRVKATRGALAESYDSWDAADLAYQGGGDG